MPDPRPPRATIADVAREAGVSRTTVSHALNGLGKVNPQTRERVKAVAQALNYRPSARARGLRSGRSGALALLSSMPAEVSAGPSQLGFFTELAMVCARTALLSGYVFVLAPPVDGAEDRLGEDDPLDRLDIDGAILLEPLTDDPIAARLGERGIPYVTIGAPGTGPEDTGPEDIGLDHEGTARLLLDHLLDRGARQPALLVGGSDRGAQQAARTVYAAAAAEHGFTPIVTEVDERDGEEGGARAAADLLAATPEIDALFVPIDTFATGAVRAGAAAGRVIGEDLLIATRYDGLRARTSVPPLTAVDLGLDEVARRAVDLLLTVIDDSASQGRQQADSREAAPTAAPALVVRASTAGTDAPA